MQRRTLAKKDFRKSFVDLPAAEKQTLLHEPEAGKSGNAGLAYFYAATGQLTIQAYTASKYFLTKVQVYGLAPDRFHYCVPVKKTA